MEIPTSQSAEYYEIIRSIQKTNNFVNNNNNNNHNNNISKSTKLTDTSNLAIWAVADGVLLVFIIGGNILTILAVRFSRRLRSVISNMFVLSLAISDMLVGFTLPYHLAFYMGSQLGKTKEYCLLRFFLIILACCNSIWNLITIAVDRYIAIFYPLHYNKYMTKKVALVLLSFGWIVGAIFATIPMIWNNWDTARQCEFDEILKPWYIAGVITPGFSMIWFCMIIVYWRIWREASKHVKQLRSSFTGLHETPSDSKSVQVVLIILGCFSICWLPYFIIACVQIYKLYDKSTPMLYKAVFSMAMANSGMNPIIYAWKNTGFRRAFARLLRCQSPDYCDHTTSQQHSNRSQIQQNRKNSSFLQHHDGGGGTNNSSILYTPPPYLMSPRELNDTPKTINTDISGTTDDDDRIFTFNERRRKTSFSIDCVERIPMKLKTQIEPATGEQNLQQTELNHKIINENNSNTNCKNLIIDQIEFDGNGNTTKIHIINNFKNNICNGDNIDDNNDKQQQNDSYELTLNCKNFKNKSNISNNCSSNNHHVQFAQLFNGKHVISSNEKIQNEII